MNIKKASILVVLLATFSISPAHATGGSKVKPPTAEQTASTTWYSDFFNLFK